MHDFRDVSVWVQPPPDLQPALDADTRADVVVVGGGLTGLSTALSLRAAGVDVAILEMDYCGKGASGRNAGHLTPTIGKDLPTLVKYVGKGRAAELAGFADRAVRYTEAAFARHAIDCDYAPVGNIIAGVHPRHRAPLERAAELAAGIGVAASFLDEAAMRRRGLPAAFRFGVLEATGGHLDPGKYVMGLRRAALQAGVRIYEQSRVDRLETTGRGVRAVVGKAAIVGERLVLATNAYTPSTLGRMGSRVFPLRVTLFRTAPLDSRQRQALGWPGGEGVYTAHESLESYRMTADGRLLGGSKYVQYGYGGGLADGDRPDVFRRYDGLLRERFAEVPDLKIETFWGGWIAMTIDFLPFSHADRRRRVFHGMGYNGHGVAQATYNGALLADQVLDRPNGDVDLLQRRSPPLPPEPLRWLLVQALMRIFEGPDRRVDADLSAGRR
ncbi:NAD(P)/FAD-dependent oxidoreductase [Caulobacter sp. KR2-114]|uniref:NAD(P)/FAD-dependent oxidoreductase n=1 Tax=Caulobacter sp. KR2-114 TaxID=3400912 RepID=UPI003C01D37A